jgi:hypothetical protein
MRPRATDRLPARVVITAIETRAVQWVDSDTGRADRCLLRDMLGPWEPHEASDRAASDLIDQLRALPPEQHWFEAVHVGYGGYGNFGIVAHLSVTQAEKITRRLVPHTEPGACPGRMVSRCRLRRA